MSKETPPNVQRDLNMSKETLLLGKGIYRALAHFKRDLYRSQKKPIDMSKEARSDNKGL